MLQRLSRKFRGWLQGADPAAQTDAGSARTGDSAVPDGARRLYETGVELLRSGKASEALVPLDEAVAAHPHFAEAHDQAGLALRALGRHEEALARFQRALDARHDYVPAINHQGIAYLELQRYEEAEDSFKLALAYEPGSPEPCVHLAMTCWNQRRVDAAIAHFRRALELDSGLAEAHLMLATLLHSQGRLDEALESYRLALALTPGIPELHLNCGLTLLKLGRADEATDRFAEALALKPDFAEAYFNLGNARREQNRNREAIECYERAAELKPDYADAYTNLGSVLREQGAVDRALECYRRAVSLDPASVEPHHNMGVVFDQLGNMREAIACYEAAQRVKPEHPESQLNLAIARLALGDFKLGWEGYEWRFRQTNPELGAHVREFPYPRWNGQPLAGKRILVWGEQGIGDEILFAATYQEVIDAAQDCLIECAPKLVPLFSRSFPGARVVAKSDPPHPETAQGYDYQCPAGGLPRWLRPTLASFPRHGGYLSPPANRVAYWRARVAGLGAGPKIGFSWRSSNLKGARALHCTTLDQWGPIFSVRGAHFVNLQYDECAAELAHAREQFGVPVHAFVEVDLYNDLDEAAALTLACDLVISAPTAVSFLAGALGVPTWQMTYGTDWSKHGTEGYPCFPAITLFHRIWPREWDEILAEIGVRLRDYVKEHS
jgi:tetratricopeptide (TPR) repeat protein